MCVLVFVSLFIRSSSAAAVEKINGASWLFPMHTTLLTFAYAAFFVVFVASIMYLLQERELKLKRLARSSIAYHR